MKKVKLGGRRQKKTTNFMSEDEEDGGLGLDGRLEGGEEEDNLARSSFFFSFLQFLFFLKHSKISLLNSNVGMGLTIGYWC